MASAISTKPIPLNYPAHLRQLYLDYETGDKSLPERLVPDVSTDDQVCQHGNAWRSEDPVKKKWRIDGRIVRTGSCVISIDVYYRPTVKNAAAPCKCRYFNDGLDHLLFHYKPGILFYHGMLIQQLATMCEGRCPLAALHRSMIRTNRYIGMAPTIT